VLRATRLGAAVAEALAQAPTNSASAS